MALVSQEAVLFDISIRDNIKYGDLTRDISDEEIILAAKRSNIHDFILTLPEVQKLNVSFFKYLILNRVIQQWLVLMVSVYLVDNDNVSLLHER
jgi:ABC-type multidrug transport system fused ATPase/permease subunit